MELNSTILQLKISLDHIKPPIWRRVQVPSDITFEDFHIIIQKAMGWRSLPEFYGLHYHLHEFRFGKTTIGKSSNYGNYCLFSDDELMLNEQKVKLSEYFTAPKAKCKYLYDFGDDWMHTVLMEKKLPVVEGQTYPKCVAGKRFCPPEDCGGVCGYEEHMEIMKNPRNRKHKSHMEWLKDRGYSNLQPESFDPAVVF